MTNIELDFPALHVEGAIPTAQALLAVCEYFDVPVHGGGPFEALLRQAPGSSATPNDVVNAAADVGLTASFVDELSLDQLGVFLEEGCPVLTMDPASDCVVVVGVSVNAMLVFDPATGFEEIPNKQWSGWGVVIDAPGVERDASVQDFAPADPDRDLAAHYASVWNILHANDQAVPAWEWSGAHEELDGTPWHVDLGHDGVWRPMHSGDLRFRA